MRELSSNSVSGDARIRGNLADGGKLSAESVSGDISIAMPRSLSAHVVGESFSGSLQRAGRAHQQDQVRPGLGFRSPLWQRQRRRSGSRRSRVMGS